MLVVGNALSDVTLLLGQVFWLNRFYTSYVHSLIHASLTGIFETVFCQARTITFASDYFNESDSENMNENLNNIS